MPGSQKLDIHGVQDEIQPERLKNVYARRKALPSNGRKFLG